MKTIFEYLDYREFLQLLFDEKKKLHEFYSYRLFSQKAGFKSPNFLKLVINGDRNLTKESVFKVAKAFDLNKKEADYFENLVFLNQSKTLEEKNMYLTRLMRHRVKSDPRKLEESEFEYYSNWYNPVIHEMITAFDFRDNFKKLGLMLVPAVSASDAENSVALLLRLNLIRKCDNGQYIKTTASLTTGPQVRSVAIANYHKAMMKLAAESIERIPPAKRDISSITISVSDDTFKMIIDKLQSMRKELMELAESDSSPQKVVQLNLQLFPLSNDFGNREESSC